MMNTAGHWFWWALTGLCVVWYSTITIYVAFKGAFDIKGMLGRLSALGNEDAAAAESVHEPAGTKKE